MRFLSLAFPGETNNAHCSSKVSCKVFKHRYLLKSVYLLTFCTTLETKLREFQFKIVKPYCLYKRKTVLFRYGWFTVLSFCWTEVESVEHLPFPYNVSSSFWKHVLSWLRDYNISVDTLKEEDVIFGKLDIAEGFLL